MEELVKELKADKESLKQEKKDLEGKLENVQNNFLELKDTYYNLKDTYGEIYDYLLWVSVFPLRNLLEKLRDVLIEEHNKDAGITCSFKIYSNTSTSAIINHANLGRCKLFEVTKDDTDITNLWKKQSEFIHTSTNEWRKLYCPVLTHTLVARTKIFLNKLRFIVELNGRT